MEEIVVNYLKYLNIPISKKYIQKNILSHPDYPSLLSIADTLVRLGIDYQVGQLETQDVDELPIPCITHLNRGGGQLVLLKDQDDLDRHQSDIEAWDGVVLKVKATDFITDEEHNEQYAKENNRRKLSAVLAVALLGLTVLPVLQVSSWLYFSLFATSMSGAVVGYLLLAKDLGVTYKAVERFCNPGKGTNCDHILNAEDAKVFGFLSFTDAAASYFFFQFLLVGLFIPLFESISPFLSVLAVVSMLTIPVICYSLYYQAVKAKSWCRLCVLVDILLVLQAGLFLLMYVKQMFVFTDFQLVSVLISTFLLTSVISSILLLKYSLRTVAESISEITIANRVKYDPEIFMHLLMREKRVNDAPFSPEMTLGSREAPVQILMAVNLHCNPCRIAFESVRQILASYPEKVCISLRFTKGMDNTIGELSASTYLVRYWHQFTHGGSEEAERTKDLLVNWYSEMDSELFAKQYPLRDRMVKLKGDCSVKLETQHYEWFEQNEIKRTPTFFINGYKMPKQYRIKDLMTMLPGIVAQLGSSVKITNGTTKEIA
jgi:hypothetical protein